MDGHWSGRWLGSRKSFTKGNGCGPLIDTVMGIGGAVVGGFLMSSARLGGYGGTINTTLVAMVGAVLLIMLAGFANGRRVTLFNSKNPGTESFRVRRFELATGS
jgi:uncharacterized membrane protein YeaQ/YmgE (transglycosylase-associated protein family)